MEIPPHCSVIVYRCISHLQFRCISSRPRPLNPIIIWLEEEPTNCVLYVAIHWDFDIFCRCFSD